MGNKTNGIDPVAVFIFIGVIDRLAQVHSGMSFAKDFSVNCDEPNEDGNIYGSVRFKFARTAGAKYEDEHSFCINDFADKEYVTEFEDAICKIRANAQAIFK